MTIRKINNIPNNVSALVVGKQDDQEQAVGFLKFISISVILGAIYLNYKYYTGKI